MNSRTFFINIVEPTVREFLDRPGDERKGMLAAIVLNHMVDYYAHDLAKSSGKVRIQLVSSYPKLISIQDVADAAKHAKLDRRPRTLTESNQIEGPPGLFEAPFGTGVYREAWKVIVTNDDDTTFLLESVVREVCEIWRAMLEKEEPGLNGQDVRCE